MFMYGLFMYVIFFILVMQFILYGYCEMNEDLFVNCSEVLCCLLLRLWLVVELEVRLCDCKVVVKYDFVEKQYWEYMDF